MRKRRRCTSAMLMTQPGETEGYTATEHVEALVAHSHKKIADYVLLNSDFRPAAGIVGEIRA